MNGGINIAILMVVAMSVAVILVTVDIVLFGGGLLTWKCFVKTVGLNFTPQTIILLATPLGPIITERQPIFANSIAASVGKIGLQKISPHILYGCKVWEIMIQLMQLITNPYRKENKYG